MFPKNLTKWLTNNGTTIAIALIVAAMFYMFVVMPGCSPAERFSPYPESIGKKLDDAGKDTPDGMFASASDPTVLLNGASPDMLPKPSQEPENWEDLLPADADLKNQNFLQPQEFIGMDTVSSSLRNANYDLRAAPPNPRVNVGPWNNSTIEYDGTGI